MKKYSSLLLVLVSFFFISCKAQEAQNEEKKVQLEDIKVTLKTEDGDIKATIFASKTPVTAANFLNLTKRGYYNGTFFHRVVPGFVSQAGKHNSGEATPGYTIKNETYTEHPELKDLKHDKAGVLSMARTAIKHTNGSQFYITHVATPHLDGAYTVFGEVTEGVEIAKKITRGTKITSIEIHDSTDKLFKAQKKNIDEWNAVLDKRFYDLNKVEEK